MSNLTKAALADILARNDDLGLKPEYRLSAPRRVRSGTPHPSAPVAHPEPRKPRRNRYSEQAGELGLKIRAHTEQINGQIRLWLPYPPQTNNRLAVVNGHMFKTAEAKSYKKTVNEALVGIKPLTGDLEVVMTINRPRRRGDIDNILKSCFDALTGFAFIDDEQIAMLDAKRYDGEYAREFPGIQIQIKQIA